MQFQGALLRYRVLAFITGVFLILVFAGLIARELFDVDNPTFRSVTTQIAIIHGWIFIVYVAFCGHLWMIMKWGWGRLLVMVAGGVVPVLSFVVERKIVKELSSGSTSTPASSNSNSKD